MCTLPNREFQYYGFTWYQLPQSNNYPLFHYNNEYHINTVVRIHCTNYGNITNVDEQNGCCVNNANGGYFRNSGSDANGNCNGTAILTFGVLNWQQSCQYVRYTTDGSDPTINSSSLTLSNNVMTISKAMTIRASCQFINGTMDKQITQSQWVLGS